MRPTETPGHGRFPRGSISAACTGNWGSAPGPRCTADSTPIPGKTLIRTGCDRTSVDAVSAPESPQQCFLTEWYQPALRQRDIDDVVAELTSTTARMHNQGHSIRLLVTVNAPTDEVLYSVFAAESADVVMRACRGAGWPVDRITCGVQTRMPQ